MVVALFLERFGWCEQIWSGGSLRLCFAVGNLKFVKIEVIELGLGGSLRTCDLGDGDGHLIYRYRSDD